MVNVEMLPTLLLNLTYQPLYLDIYTICHIVGMDQLTDC